MSNLGWKFLLIAVVVGGALAFGFPPKDRINLGLDLRGGVHILWQVEMEAHADDTTAQMLVLQTMVGLAQSGIPVDPEIVSDLLPLSRDRKLQQAQFVKTQLAQSAETAKREEQLRMTEIATTAQRTKDIVDIEASKVTQRGKASERDHEIDKARITLEFAKTTAQFMLGQEEGRSDREVAMLKMLIDLAESELRGDSSPDRATGTEG